MVDSKQTFDQICENFIKMTDDDNISKSELNELTKEIKEEHFTFENTKGLISALINATSAQFKDESDQKKLACLKKVTAHVLDTFFARKGAFDTMFFPNQESEKKLIKYLNMATTTLDICVFTISNDHLANTLSALHKKGIKLRIISDDECVNNQGSDINTFAKEGIPVRTDDDKKAHMHNKYVIVDSKFVITGSFNWTVSAVKANQENLVVVENDEVVKGFNDNFNMLWKNFEKNVIKA